jgi:hypothetical protein
MSTTDEIIRFIILTILEASLEMIFNSHITTTTTMQYYHYEYHYNYFHYYPKESPCECGIEPPGSIRHGGN